jgi:uncharacterized protein with FMN-binding domain
MKGSLSFGATSVVVLLAAIGGRAVLAQRSIEETGISVTVFEATPRRAPVVGATVVYEQPTYSSEAVTDLKGRCKVTGLTEGTYLLTISAEGFIARANLPVTVVNGAITPVEVALRPEKDVPPTPDDGRFRVVATDFAAADVEKHLNEMDAEGWRYAFSIAAPAGTVALRAGFILLVFRKD